MTGKRTLAVKILSTLLFEIFCKKILGKTKPKKSSFSLPSHSAVHPTIFDSDHLYSGETLPNFLFGPNGKQFSSFFVSLLLTNHTCTVFSPKLLQTFSQRPP